MKGKDELEGTRSNFTPWLCDFEHQGENRWGVGATPLRRTRVNKHTLSISVKSDRLFSFLQGYLWILICWEVSFIVQKISQVVFIQYMRNNYCRHSDLVFISFPNSIKSRPGLLDI